MLQLKKFPDIPVSIQEEARGSRPHPEELRFCLVARDEGSFPCLVGKEIRAFPSHFKRRRSPQERRKELLGRATIPRVPQMSQSIPGKPETAATAREEIAHACPQSRRGLTPLGRLQKYPQIHVSTGQESSGSCSTPHKVLGPGIDGR